MFDNTILPTDGMLTAVVQHPTTKRETAVEFYIAKHHNQPILGLEACLYNSIFLRLLKKTFAQFNKQRCQINRCMTKEIIFQRYRDD
jgi:hypothetical protein